MEEITLKSLLKDTFKVAGEGLGTLVLGTASVSSGLLTITAVLADPSNTDKYGAMFPLTAALGSAAYTEVLAEKTKQDYHALREDYATYKQMKKDNSGSV